jgi:hypothetical protein
LLPVDIYRLIFETMAKKLIGFIILLTVLASCSKDLSAPVVPFATPNTIGAQVDGAPAAFNSNASGDTMYSERGGHILVVTAWDGPKGSSDYISFSIVSPDHIGIGSYSPSSFLYWQQSDSTAYSFSNASDVHLMITSVTDSTIEGFFSGTVFQDYHNGTYTEHTITNGSFNVTLGAL